MRCVLKKNNSDEVRCYDVIRIGSKSLNRLEGIFGHKMDDGTFKVNYYEPTGQIDCKEDDGYYEIFYKNPDGFYNHLFLQYGDVLIVDDRNDVINYYKISGELFDDLFKTDELVEDNNLTFDKNLIAYKPIRDHFNLNNYDSKNDYFYNNNKYAVDRIVNINREMYGDWIHDRIANLYQNKIITIDTYNDLKDAIIYEASRTINSQVNRYKEKGEDFLTKLEKEYDATDNMDLFIDNAIYKITKQSLINKEN